MTTATQDPTRAPAFTPSPDLYPFPSRWLDSSAGGVHYVDEGAGRPILMCHGNHDVELSVPQRHPRAARSLALRGPRPAGLRAVRSAAGLWLHAGARVMSSRPLQRAILERNLFVERVLPAGVARTLSSAEMKHYRAVQPTADARVAVAEAPRQIVAARPWLAELADAVPRKLGAKRALVTFPLRDVAFTAKTVLPRMRAAFSDLEVVELPRAKHFFVEDAPGEVATTIARRFGAR